MVFRIAFNHFVQVNGYCRHVWCSWKALDSIRIVTKVEMSESIGYL